MKCKKCGYPRVSYKESRRKRWKGRFGDSSRVEKGEETRTSFQINPCPKCGYKGDKE